MKLAAIIENMDDEILRRYAEACGWALARAHARSGDAAMISGYMGSGAIFDEAILDFAVEYADQAERDHKAFVRAVREGRVKAVVES
jgi:thiamine monophosphate kinase